MADSDLGKKAKTSIFYNIAAKGASTLGQLFGTVFLARLLVPEDFGIVTTGMLVIGFATKFGEFGFHQGLIQRKEAITRKHINTLFTIDFTFKAVLWLIIFLLSSLLAGYFNEPALATALPVLSLYILLECFSTTPLTVLKRDVDFKSVSINETIEMFTTIVLSIALAFLGFGLWSLIYSKLTGITVAGILAMRKTHWVPKFTFNRRAGKELFHFGAMIFVRNLFRYGADNVDYFFVSKYIGAQALGLYEKAFILMRMPQKRITRSVNRVIFSAFSRIQDDPERIRKIFCKLVLAVSLLSYPLLTGLALVAQPFIAVLLGEKWLGAALPLQIMCIAGILRSIDPFLNSTLTATGYVRSTVTRRALEFVLLAVTTFLGIQYGLAGVATAVGFSAIIVMIVMMNMITKVTKIQWRDYFGPQMPAIVTSLCMLIAMYVSRSVLVQYVDPLGPVILVSLVAIGTLVYLGLLMIFRFKMVTELLDELRGDTKGVTDALKKKFSRSKKKPKLTMSVELDNKPVAGEQ
ncbi:MAG: lipopolysaccharide biosynthesis protein [bacterium]